MGRAMNPVVIKAGQRVRRDLRRHLRNLGFKTTANGIRNSSVSSKEGIRLLHRKQRIQKLRDARSFVKRVSPELLKYFASGHEVSPAKIAPRLHLIDPDTWESDLFRLASLTWSVPVSQGYGRRMRFLVWDEYNCKLIGIFALGSPVFNLKVRDERIGWKAKQREEQLVNVMDAHVLGALPPYNTLLGGKMVACLIRSREVRDAFTKKYKNYKGIISGKRKSASLVLVTTSSALGPSAVYDRLRLNGQWYYESIGFTSGWGHFHVPDKLFEQMRQYLALRRHRYSKNHQYGSGPNWRLRTIKTTLQMIGLSPNLLRHGINREVFVCKLASNAERFLRGEVNRPYYKNLLSVREIGELTLERWVIPRAERRPDFVQWKRENMLVLLDPHRVNSEPSNMKLNSGSNNRLVMKRSFTDFEQISSNRHKHGGVQMGEKNGGD